MRLQGQQVRTLTFGGTAAALAAFFGAPVGGGVFALELPHRRGLEYYEALIPALASALAASAVFGTLVPQHGPVFPFPAAPESEPETMLLAVPLGIGGAAPGAAFIVLFRAVGALLRPLTRWSVVLGTLGGAVLGLLAGAVPAWLPSTTLFWGELQLRDLIPG